MNPRKLILLSKRNSKIFNSIDETIGNTPMVNLCRLKQKLNLNGNIIAKLESFNPLGSVKDRIGLAMINNAEEKKLINPKSTIIEATSGNTGIALAFICASRGYKLILTMPDSMSVERKKMLKFFGAELILTPKKLGMKGAMQKALEVKKKISDSIILNQFENEANPEIHFQTTAEEIWSSCHGKIDCFISGVGTGGTITGVGKYLKNKKKDIVIVAVEPEDSAVISGLPPGQHLIQGIGAGFVPKNLDLKIVDKVLSISNNSAFSYARMLARLEGIAGGISSGAVLAAAIEMNEDKSMTGKNTVIILPSFAERYLSTPLFSEMSDEKN
ncbi:MAG: cysteine synthase A [Alphaproteobacteria bacterium]